MNVFKLMLVAIVGAILPMSVSATNKAELVEAIVLETGRTRIDVENTIESFLDLVKQHLVQGEQVSLVGFGTFSVKERAGRTGRNPQTGETIHIPASKIPTFKAGRILKDAVNK